jgi:hypothetical protein
MKTSSLRCALVVVLAAPVAGGCATTVNGVTQRVRIETKPAGASLTILQTGQHLVAPAEVELRRDAVYTVEARLEGFEPAIGYIDRVASGAVLGNILIGGTIGARVDADSGGGYTLVPDPLVVPLIAARPDAEAAAQSPAAQSDPGKPADPAQ